MISSKVLETLVIIYWMFTKFSHHLSNVQKALGIEVNTFNIMDFLYLSQNYACHRKKQEHPLEVRITLA